MKKFIYTLGIVAAAAFAFSACQKEKDVKADSSDKLVTITFTAEKAGLGTRTAAVEGENSVSFIWTDEDVANIKLFTVGVGTDGKETLTEVANPTVSKVSDTKLTIAGQVAPDATYTFRAILCDPQSYTGSGTDYSTRKPKIKAVQTPDNYNNFDPNADILVSDDMEVIVPAGDGETISSGDLLMVFRRQVVVNKMTLKNFTAGEKISKVQITSLSGDNNSGHLTGYMEGSTMKGQSKTITLEYDNVVVPDNLQFPVYFVSMSNKAIALKIDVTTDKFVYTKSFAEGKTIDLNLGQFTVFGVALPAGTPVTTVADGDYYITGVKSSQVYAANMYVSGNNLTTLPITVNVSNEKIDYVNDIEDCIFTLTRITEGDYAGKYTIQDVNGLYLYAAGGDGTGGDPSNHLKGEEAPDSNGNAYWTVSKKSDGTYDIQSVGTAVRKILRYNSTNNIFSCYASGQTDVTIYPASWCTIDTTPVLTIDDSERTKSVGCNESSVVFAYFANRYASQPIVSIISDADHIISGDPVVSNGTITVDLNPNSEDEAKTATLSVTSTGLESAVTLTINQAEYTESQTVRYTYTITTSDFTAAGYGKEIKDITATEVGGSRTMTVSHSDVDAGLQSGNIQFKRSAGMLYNTTDLGNVVSVTLNSPSASNSYTVYLGSSEKPTAVGSGGFFCIKETGGNILKCTSITVVFEREESGSGGNEVVKGSTWSSGDFTSQTDIPSTINGVTLSSSIDPTGFEGSVSSSATYEPRGLTWGSGKSPVITLANYSGGIETVTIVMSTNGSSTSVAVSAGGTSLDGQTVTSGTSNANTAYTFTFSELKTGNITISVTNTASKSVYIKSISIN